MDAFFEFSLGVTRWLQQSYPQLEGFFKFITAMGYEEFYLLLLPLIYWCLDKRLGKVTAYLFILSSGVNGVLKQAFRGPRPFWLESGLGLSSETSYGIPSGHAQLSTTVFLLIGCWLKRRWTAATAVLIIFLISLSRVYLGVHFIHDVAAGLGIGLLVLLGYLIWAQKFARWFGKRILGQQLLAAMLVPLSITAVYILIRLVIGKTDQSVPWASFIPEAELAGLESAATTVGALLGSGLGLLFEASRVRFKVTGPLWQRAVRYVFGIVITVVIWAGLKAVFPADPLWLAVPLRILRYTLILLWVTYYAPMAFIKLKLAEAKPDPGIVLSF